MKHKIDGYGLFICAMAIIGGFVSIKDNPFLSMFCMFLAGMVFKVVLDKYDGLYGGE